MTRRLLRLALLPLLTAVAATSQPSAEGLLQAKPFTDPKCGLSLRLPTGWEPKPDIQDTGYQSPTRDESATGSSLAPNVVMSKGTYPGLKPADLAQVLDANRQQYSKQFPGYTDDAKPGTVVPTLPGKGAGRIDAVFKANCTVPVHMTQVWIIGDGVAYAATFTSLADAQAKDADLFDAMIRSMRVP